VLGEEHSETRLIRVLAWAAFSAAHRVAERVAEQARRSLTIPRSEYRKSA